MRPTLRLVDSTPIVLRGSHFRAHERVLVRLTVSELERARNVRANAAGSFTVTYASVSFDRCSADFSAVATGRSGSRASVKLAQLACPPPLSP
jgi:hypothetical protein